MTKAPDYKTLIDKEVWEFIERTDRWYPADAVDKTIDEQRAIYTAMCREFYNGQPDGVSVDDATIASDGVAIPIRRYTSSQANNTAMIVYFHGGGFVVGGLDSHDDVCAELCEQTQYDVTSVDYRLSPEHKHPAAFNDCVATVLHEAELQRKPILLCGDSAGGNLAAAVSHYIRDTNGANLIVGQVLIYPELGGDKNVGSYVYHANAPMLTKDEVDFYLNVRVDGVLPEHDVTLSPLQDSDFSNLPPTLAVSAECDPLADDARHYCEAINSAGGQAQWRNEPGLVHGYLRARHSSRRAAASFADIARTLREFADTA